ncbi:MAG TPA: hypothetical protein VGF97_11305 [Rhizomicrobium sp.]
MTRTLARTAFDALLLSTAVCLAATTAQAADKVSRAVAPQIMEAQKDLQAKDYQGAMTVLKQAQASGDLKPYDLYVINRFIASAAISLNDMPTAAAAAEAAADSGAAPDEEKKAVLHDAIQLAQVVQQWPKVVTYGQQLAAMNGLDYQTASMLAIGYYKSSDFPHAQQYAQQSIDMAKAAGQPPDQNALQIIVGSQVNQNNQAGAEQTLEQLAVQSNSPETWSQLTGVALGAKGMKELYALYLYRLRLLAGAMSQSDDYTVLGSLTSQLGYPTESASAYRQGISSGKITSAQAGSTYTKAQHDAVTDERSLPEIAASAAKSKNGEQDVKLGEDYWGYGRYADAEAAAQRAIGKGGLKDPNEGPLLVGAAQTVQGKYAQAIQTFSQISGSEAVTRTAHLWSLYAQAKQKGQPAAASGQTPPQ